jgi:hypothetical protein
MYVQGGVFLSAVYLSWDIRVDTIVHEHRKIHRHCQTIVAPTYWPEKAKIRVCLCGLLVANGG